MAEPSATVDGAAQINIIYQALGRFMVEFSRMVGAMETELYFVIGGNQLLLRSLVAEMTAAPLCAAWRSVMMQAIELTPEDADVLKHLTTEVSALINLRNDWAHGMWMVGYGDDYSRAQLDRFKNSAKGLARPSNLEPAPSASYIERAATHTSIVAQAVFTYGATVHMLLTQATKVRPSDRIHITKKDRDGHRQVQVTSNGKDWVTY